jgi:23S rRNA (cytidine2498-2'-O)-methyltransferase
VTLHSERVLTVEADLLRGPGLIFARQYLPKAELHKLTSINAWAGAVVERCLTELPEDQPWRLHLVAVYGDSKAGANRVKLIRTVVKEQLQKRRRRLLKTLEEVESPMGPAVSLIQLVLTAPDQGLISAAVAPLPHEARHVIAPFVAGGLPVAEDKSAPSRAFAKLVEAQQRLGHEIEAGQSCVDLGACPGGWTYVAVNQGAKVTAVDRSPLRDDLMRHSQVEFILGDAFKFQPSAQVDWLICDVIAAPERSIELLQRWAKERLMRGFIVALKFKGTADYPKADVLAQELAPLCQEFRLQRLNANKNEACAMGWIG